MNDTAKFLEEVEALARKYNVTYEIKVNDKNGTVVPIVTFEQLYDAVTGAVLLWKNEIAVSKKGNIPIWYFSVNRYDNLNDGHWKVIMRAYEDYTGSGECIYHGSISYNLVHMTNVPESVRIINQRDKANKDEDCIKEFDLADNIIDHKVLDQLSTGFGKILRLAHGLISAYENASSV